MKVIFDTDPGTDDALAIMMALNSPDIEVLGLTTTGGNASTANATSNALRLLNYVDRLDVPVARGGPRPLEGVYHPNSFHGRAGLSVNLPLPDVKPVAVSARDYIISMASTMRGELSMFAVGPLTNVAKAILKEPRLPSWIKHLYIMGGTVDGRGNRTPHAEFNIWDDALAAQIGAQGGPAGGAHRAELAAAASGPRGLGGARPAHGGGRAASGGDDVAARLGVGGDGGRVRGQDDADVRGGHGGRGGGRGRGGGPPADVGAGGGLVRPVVCGRRLVEGAVFSLGGQPALVPRCPRCPFLFAALPKQFCLPSFVLETPPLGDYHRAPP